MNRVVGAGSTRRHPTRLTMRIPAASPELLPLDEAAEAARVAQVEQLIGSTSPGLAQYTTEALFRNLWLRPDLAPRDRRLAITVAEKTFVATLLDHARHVPSWNSCRCRSP